MSTQIFKKGVPNELIINLLDNICTKNDKYYILNPDNFKKGIYTGEILTFLSSLKEYYYNSKLKYIERKVTYNSFTTILRQLCNFNKITYTSKIKYNKSVYDINYIIYL